MAEKTNMEYLKEFIKDNEEALEFWEAVQNEIIEIKGKLFVEQINNRELKTQMENMEEMGYEELITIDCGIGIIEYLEPDNLQLQSLMEDFKEKHQVTAR